jgi:hypothetical protein
MHAPAKNDGAPVKHLREGVRRGTMRAVVLSRPGAPESLVLTELPLPQPQAGWVRIPARVGAGGDLSAGAGY